MKKIACYILFILNTFSVDTWSAEFGFPFLDDDLYATSLVSVPPVSPNPRYSFTAEEFDFFLQFPGVPLISIIPAIQHTNDIDHEEYAKLVENVLNEERGRRGEESRLILVPFMPGTEHWDALVVCKDHEGFKGFYARSSYDSSFMGMALPILKRVYGYEIELQEIKGYHLVDYRPEDTGVVALNNLLILSGGSICEASVFSTLPLRQNHIESAARYGEIRFLNRQTYNLPSIFYMNGGNQHRCHLKVMEIEERDSAKLDKAIEEVNQAKLSIEKIHEEVEEKYLSLGQLFNGNLLDWELKDEVSFPLQVKTKKQIPWTVLRFLPDIELGNIPEDYQEHRINSMIRHFFDYIQFDYTGREERDVLGNISRGLNSLKNGNQTIDEEDQAAFEIFGRFAGWFYDYEIIKDLLRRIEMIETSFSESQSMAVLRLIQVAGEYFPHMTGWLLQNSEEGTEGVTSLETYAYVFSELRNVFAHRHLGLLPPTFRSGKPPRLLYDEGLTALRLIYGVDIQTVEDLLESGVDVWTLDDFLQEVSQLKEVLIRARDLKDEQKREYRSPAAELEFILEDTFLKQRKVRKQQVETKNPTLYKFLERLKEQTEVSAASSVKEPSRIEGEGELVRTFLPDAMMVEGTPLSLEERRGALRSLLTSRQSYTQRYAGIDEYIEFVRNIRKNVGLSIEEDYYWSETPSYSEILFFRKLGRPLLTGEEKRQARHRYAEDVLKAFDNLRRFSGIDETLETLAARREHGLEIMPDDMFYGHILEGEFEGLFSIFRGIEDRLKHDFEEDPSRHLGVELLFGAVIEQMKHLFYFPEFKGKFGERWQIRNYYDHPLPHGKTPLYLIDSGGEIVNWLIDPAPHRDGGRQTLAQHLAQISIVIPWIIRQNFDM